MTTYAVYPRAVISTFFEVDADDPDEAIDKALDLVPPTVLFGDYTYPDVGEWEVDPEHGIEEITP